MSEALLCDFQGKPALEVWTTRDIGKLHYHLHNDNGPFDWVMGFLDKKARTKNYKRSKNVPVKRGISWALATTKGSKSAENSLCFVPYSTNSEQMSRWGGFDFDAHDGDIERARRHAFAAFRRLLNYDAATILESSGSGGWHVWTIAKEFKPVAHWILLLKAIAREICAPIESGICEIFPPDTLSRGFGKGLRAPGAWNPGTNTLSEIWWQNADPLIESLPDYASVKSRRIGEVTVSLPRSSSIEKKTSLSLLPLCDLQRMFGVVECFGISQMATRREKLQSMVGTLFHQVSFPVAAYLAQGQFSEKTVSTNADEAEHMREFAAFWQGLETLWLVSLHETEREHYTELTTEAERGAFRIIRSYAHNPANDGSPDFPIAAENLGHRIGITREGAGQLRRKFSRLGIIFQTVPYRPNVAAARFQWLLHTVAGF